MRSAPPVSLYLLEPVLQAEYQRFMPDFTAKFQNKQNGRCSACISTILGNDFAGRVPAHSKLCIYFYLFIERLSHCCAEIPAGIRAGIPQLTGNWQKQNVLCPAVPAPKGTVAVRTAGILLDAYSLLVRLSSLNMQATSQLYADTHKRKGRS